MAMPTKYMFTGQNLTIVTKKWMNLGGVILSDINYT
jgi:hypothetical protein